MPRIHNISNVTSKKPMAITIGHIQIRPGKYKDVPAESVNAKVKVLHGNTIWLGDVVPSRFVLKEVTPKPQSLSRDEISAYLFSQPLETLIDLTKHVTPAVVTRDNAPYRRYVYALTAACTSSDFDLDPEKFFWLGRWNLMPNGDYQEI